MELKINKHIIKIIFVIIVLLIIVVFALQLISSTSKKIPGSSPTLVTKQPKKTLSVSDLISNYPFTASESARSKYRELIQNEGREVKAVTFKDCKPSPQIILAKQNDKITFINTDNQDRSLTVALDQKVELPKNSSASVSMDFEQGTGLYTITCSSTNSLVGIILTSP